MAAAARALGLTGKRQQVYESIVFHLADSRNPDLDLSLTQIFRLCSEDAEISRATVRRTMAVLVSSGQAVVKVAGSQGKGLETVWVVDRVVALAEAYPTALKLTREGRLPGRQKGSHNRQLAREAVAKWEALTGMKPALLRGQKLQAATLLGEFPSSFQSSGIPDLPHSKVEATPPAAETAGMDRVWQDENGEDRAGEGAVHQEILESVSEVLVKHLGADPRGAALRGISTASLAQLAKVGRSLHEGLAQLNPEDVPELAREVGGTAPVDHPLPFLIAILRTNPTRVHHGLERFLKRMSARIAAREAALNQAGFSTAAAATLPEAAQQVFTAWAMAKGQLPSSESAGFLEAFDLERAAYAALVHAAEASLPPALREGLHAEVRARLLSAGIPEGGLVWRRAWEHHWSAAVAEAAGFAQLVES